MALIWAELAGAEDLRRRAMLSEAARAFWAECPVAAVGGERECPFDTRIWLEAEAGSWLVRYQERAARPLAELLVQEAPAALTATLGRPPRSWEKALHRTQQRSGVDLSEARVRVGLTRGHLLELVVTIPLDVPGDEALLHEAAEGFLESLVGERLLDDWVASIDVARSARSRGLLVFQDVASSTTYPLAETENLLRRGIAGLTASLPASLIAEPQEAWTALEFEAAEGSLQAPRVFAATAYPEALKAALEGMPFHSGRFSRAEEIFVWLEWDAGVASFDERRERRDRRERELARGLAASGQACLVGSGFGASRDYLDFVVQAGSAALGELCQAARQLGADCQLGFYDSVWRDESIVVRVD